MAEDRDVEFFEVKKDKKSTFNKIMNIVLWVLLFIWMGICIVDFILAKTNNKPIFCLSRSETEYSDGKVKKCTGLGYKVYNYERESYKGVEYGPFWIKDGSPQEEKKDEKESSKEEEKKESEDKKEDKE